MEMVQESGYGHDYINYFQLIKAEGKWLIVSKTYNATPTKKEKVEEEKMAFHSS